MKPLALCLVAVLCFAASLRAAPATFYGTDTSLTVSGKINLCKGDTALLTAGYNTGYQWMKNGVPISGATHAQLRVADAGVYYAKLSNGDATDSTRKITITLVASSVPITVTGERGTITAGATYCYSDSSANIGATGDYTNYRWTMGGVSVNSATGIVLNNYSGTVTVSGVDSGACASQASFSFIALQSPADTIPLLTRTGDNLLSSQARYYRWYFNNEVMTAQTGSYIPVSKQGAYFVQTSSNKICWNQSASYVALFTARTPGDSLRVAAFPNPASGPFSLVLTYDKVKSVQVKVVIATTSGTIVWQSNKLLYHDKWIRIPVNTQLAAGMYVVNIVANGESKSVSVIVH